MRPPEVKANQRVSDTSTELELNDLGRAEMGLVKAESEASRHAGASFESSVDVCRYPFRSRQHSSPRLTLRRVNRGTHFSWVRAAALAALAPPQPDHTEQSDSRQSKRAGLADLGRLRQRPVGPHREGVRRQVVIAAAVRDQIGLPRHPI